MIESELTIYNCDNYIAECIANPLTCFLCNISKDKRYDIVNVVQSYGDPFKHLIRIVNDKGDYSNLPFKYFKIIPRSSNKYDDCFVILNPLSESNKVFSLGLLLYSDLKYGKYYQVVPGSYDEITDMISVYEDDGLSHGKYKMSIFIVSKYPLEKIIEHNKNFEKIEKHHKFLKEANDMSFDEFKNRMNSDADFANIINSIDINNLDICNKLDKLARMYTRYCVIEYIKNHKNKEDVEKMELKKTDNYKKFAEKLKEKTGCEVLIEIVEKNHYHFQLDKDGISIGVLCIDKGDPSFAPFTKLATAKNENFINCTYMPLMDDLTKVLKVLGEMFTCDLEVNKE